MDDNTLLAIKELVRLADNLDTSENYIGSNAVIRILDDLMGKVNPSLPAEQRTGDTTV